MSASAVIKRRSFLSAIGAALFGAAAPAMAKPVEPKFRRVFRREADCWREIPWEAMKAGDEVVCLELDDGKITMIDYWRLGPNLKHFLMDGTPAISGLVAMEDLLLAAHGR